MFPIGLGLVGGDLGHVLFLGLVLFQGLILLLIRRVRAGLVILEVTNEFCVDTDRAGNDAHGILGEGPCLISADNGGIGHGLTGTKDANKEILGSHSLGSKSEGEGYSEQETFWNSGDDQCDGNDQDLREGNPLLTGGTTRRKKLE